MYPKEPHILMVYPKSPSTFWSFKNALRFISKHSAEPPLGLLTVAAMLPPAWKIKLIDLNIRALNDKHILWADYVFMSGMNIHRASFKEVVHQCNRLGKPVIAGGPMVTGEHNAFLGVDHFVIGEAEGVVDELVSDLENNRLKRIYQSTGYPDIRKTPVPRWELLEMKKYATMSVQYSRGCPFDCEFCSITFLNGRKPRTKDTEQFIAELQALYDVGWRGGVFIVDDNFIGNIKKLKTDLLPGLGDWSESHRYPFHFITEASVNLAADDTLIAQMVRAGFNSVFLGIETPEEESLSGCGKKQNLRMNMVESVEKLHRAGIMVSGGFIVGFDQDRSDIFERQIQFIKNSRIVTAMVGLLNAPSGTRLFKRLKQENRLLDSMSGDNMDGSMNFIPKMDYKLLIQGYHKILTTIYSPKNYYQRVRSFIAEYRMPIEHMTRISWAQIMALLRSFWILGIRERGRKYFWNLLGFTLIKYPKKFALAVTLAVYGYHFRQVVKSSG